MSELSGLDALKVLLELKSLRDKVNKMINYVEGETLADNNKGKVKYNLKNIRKLLINGFEREALSAIITIDLPKFNVLGNSLTGSESKNSLVDKVIKFAYRKSLFDYLLDYCKQSNPKRYKKHGPYQ